MNVRKSSANNNSPWPHRLAVALVCVVFPLIWVGGLVTTYDAGMAVPDWPGTYGYNLFLYPWTTWLAGPWDLFIEHGHRLLGAAAGLITIGFVLAVFAFDRRLSMRFHAITALCLVLAQGVLGGQRVLLDARGIALIHACVGPLFFAYCAVLAVMTSRRWNQAEQSAIRNPQSAILTRLAFFGLLLAYAQLVLGAHLRHLPDDGSPRTFQIVLLFHVVVALAVVGHVVGLAFSTFRRARGERWVTRPAAGLAALLLVQLALGVATLIVKYGWPTWLGGELIDPNFTVTAQGFWSSMIVTAHVANGSLILALLAVLWARALRLYGWSTSVDRASARRAGEGPALRVGLIGGIA
jgi:cytochrome c oxidase assembly protein subunit 15